MYDASGHSMAAVVGFMERKHNLCIHIRSLENHVSAQRDKSHPCMTETAQLIQSLSADLAAEQMLRFQVEKTGLSITLCKIFWAYPEWLRDYSNHGFVPGICIDGKTSVNLSNDIFYIWTDKCRAGPCLRHGTIAVQE